MFNLFAESIDLGEGVSSYEILMVMGPLVLVLIIAPISLITALIFGIAAVIKRFTDKHWSKQLLIVSALLTCIGIGLFYLGMYLSYVHH